jgi:hypothetical protein
VVVDAASDTVLGTGWATTGASAAAIKPSARGVGWLLHETGTPARLRAHHLTNTDIHTIAARAARLRQQANGDRPDGPPDPAVNDSTTRGDSAET